MIVTLWSRDVDGNGQQFNHLSHGFHPEHDAPAYVSEAQRIAWKDGIWCGKRAELVNGKVVERG